MDKQEKIYVAGHSGLAGSAIVRRLRDEGFENVIGRSHGELDLTVQLAVDQFFAAEKPDVVFLAAGKVGGIHACSTYPADFVRENLLIQANVIDAAWRNGTRKFIFLGSSCIYPRLAPQPLKEEYLLTSELEPSNEGYAIAKIAGIKMCQAYRRQYGFNAIAVMPTNLYGPNDSFDLANGHVLPALMRKFHEAKMNEKGTVEIWGTGTPRREFLYVDDLAEACCFLMGLDERKIMAAASDCIINIGTGEDVTIKELAELLAEVTGFTGRLEFDPSRLDGTPRKLLDVSRINGLGWKARVPLKDGLARTYEWFAGRNECS